MPRDGSGNFSLPSGNPVVPNTIISSGGWANPTLNDIATAITQSLSRDGQTTPTANLPMGNFRHTGVANAANRTDYAAAGQVQDSTYQWLTSVAGTDTITASLAVPLLANYVAGQTFRFIAAGTNTTNAPTLNINSIGAKAITKNGTTALAPGDLVAGVLYEVGYDGTQFQLISVPLTGVATGPYSVRGLVGQNNAGTPNTKFDLAADAVTLKSTNNSPSRTAFGTGSLTNDTGLAGPAANGRDQAAAFGASNWIHFYFIWNGTTLATLSSLVAPATGPTLPTGYTHWAYAGAVYYNATPLLMKTRLRGSQAFYEAPQSVLSGGTAIVETAVSLSTTIPPNSLQGKLRGFFVDPTGGGTNHNAAIRIVTGVNFFLFTLASAAAARDVSLVDVPNIGQSIFYNQDVNTTNFSIDVLGYTMPNGGE